MFGLDIVNTDRGRGIRRYAGLLCAAIALVLTGSFFAHASDEAEVLKWDDLVPLEELERMDQLILEHSERIYELERDNPLNDNDPAFMGPIGTANVVEGLDGLRVQLPGYALPFEYTEDRKVTEFLLVPYFGACIHVPPPPPNQIVYVVSAESIELASLWEPIWIEGVMRTKPNLNGLGDSAYTLELEKSWPYDG